MPNNRAIAYLDAEDKSQAAFASFRGSLASTEKIVESARTALAGLFSVTAITAGVAAVVREARNAEQEIARLDAVLRATGFSSGFVRTELEGMSRALAESTMFDDGDIQTAQAALLKFGNIQGEVFERGLTLSADLAALMGTDIPAAANLVGKALQSPAEGVGALERNIGKLNGSQDRLIKDLVESGRLYEAQGEVLRILQERVGGTAEALNTGLTKATADAGKAWREFLEELGRTDGVVGGATVASLDAVTISLKAMRQELAGTRTPISDFIEEWTKLGRGLPGGGLAGVMDAYLGAAGARGTGRVGPAASGRIKGVLTPEEQEARDAAARARENAALEAEAGMGERNAATIAKLREQEAKRASEERLAREKRLQEEGLRSYVQYAQAVFDEAERLDTELARITAERFRREEEEQRRSEQLQIQAIDERERLEREAGLAANGGRAAGEGTAEAARRAADAARQLGLTFESAFEDAVVAGKSLRDVLAGISQDLSRLILRKSVTEPAAGFLTGVFKDVDLGGLFSGLFGGARAEGGPVSAGRAYLVGERGPELFVPGAGGGIVPNGVGAATSIFIDARGADAGGLAALRQELRTLYRVIPQMSVSAVATARARGVDGV
jgi:hypothetical protein